MQISKRHPTTLGQQPQILLQSPIRWQQHPPSTTCLQLPHAIKSQEPQPEVCPGNQKEGRRFVNLQLAGALADH